jgi:hypothetical protein
MSGVCRSNRVTISISEGLLVPIFCVLRVRIVISVIGGGGAGGCGCVPSTDCSVGGGERSLGLVLVVVSFSPLMGESCVSVMDVGLAGGSVYGQLSWPGEAGGE